MRRSFQDYGFVEDDAGQVIGFCLGFDFCAEHEFGTKDIKRILNIKDNPVPVGLEDRKSTSPVDQTNHLFFSEYTDSQRVRVLGGKPKIDKEPAAYLVCAGSWVMASIRDRRLEGKSRAEIIRGLGAIFYGSKSDRHYDAKRDDIAVAWSGSEGFSINVRGVDNIRRLKEIHQALVDGDICMTPPSINGFLRKSAALGIYSRISNEIKQNVIEADRERDRILQRVKECGIEERLKAAGKGWYALAPREMDDGSLQFYLNPNDQKVNASGWFTVEDLDQWIAGEGPVATGRQAEALMKDFGDSIGGLSYGILKRINDDGGKVYSDKPLMLNGTPCVKINSTHPVLNGIKTLDELKEIFGQQRRMKP